MSRSGYSDDGDFDDWARIRWRGAVTSAFKGRRGQAFLRELLTALDALPEKRLIRGDLQDPYDSNCVCSLGAVGRARGMDMERIDPEDHEKVAGYFGIAHALACEIMYENDWHLRETPEARFIRMRAWIVREIKPTP